MNSLTIFPYFNVNFTDLVLCEKCRNTEFFLVQIFLYSDSINRDTLYLIVLNTFDVEQWAVLPWLYKSKIIIASILIFSAVKNFSFSDSNEAEKILSCCYFHVFLKFKLMIKVAPVVNVKLGFTD